MRPSPFAEQPDEGELPDDPQSAEYQTGSDYAALDEDPAGGADPEEAPYDSDLYGEDDPFPDDQGEVLANPLNTGEIPRVAEVTRIAPISADEEEDPEDDENATRAGPPIHLEVISGPDQGKIKRFRGVRMVIGRTQGCDFKLADGSVSRRHLELVLGDDGVLMRDLGSGNGTRVNDQKIAEKLLEDGDEIAIGKTRFRFVDELAAMRKREAEAQQTKEAPPSEEEVAEPPAPQTEELGEDAAADEGDPEDSPAHKTKAQVAPVRGGKPAGEHDTTAHMPVRGPRREMLKNRGARSPIQALDPRHKKLIAAGGAVLVLLVILAIAISGGEPPPPPPNPNLERAALKMQEARNALRDQRFEEAITLIEEAETLVPGSDSTGMLPGAQKELQTQRGFEEVRALYRRGEFAQAKLRLAEVPLGIVLGEQARSQLEEEIVSAEANTLRAEAEAALARQDADAAEALIQRLPRTAALELMPRLEQVRQELKAQAEEDARLAAQQARGAAARSRAQRELFMEEAFRAVARKFHQGEFARAALECDRVVDAHRSDKGVRQRAAELKKKIPLFGRYLDEGDRKYRGGNLSGAAAPYRKARGLYKQIGFDGALGPIIDERLAEAALAAGKAALQRNDLASAGVNFRDALGLNPSESRAKDGLVQVEKRAEELYLQAYMIRDREPRDAAEKLRIVVDALPSDSPTREKAQNQLKALGY